jgi:hypothetical protein
MQPLLWCVPSALFDCFFQAGAGRAANQPAVRTGAVQGPVKPGSLPTVSLKSLRAAPLCSPTSLLNPPERQTHIGRSWGRRRQEPKSSKKTKRKHDEVEKTATEGATGS